ncbi:hypothetical protein QAD02_020810 [Eretmocerus hayati]|uniref:Uncharacterized protein n=1 Tax=Eretmocerus hayati TaxID=131215 RepID=A0ACC2PRN9_9HYME|nr:hypothetical protein QAD02_020810 [Eretmocerus hayati]
MLISFPMMYVMLLVILCIRYPDVAINFTIQKMEKNMQRWRAEVRKSGSGKVHTIDDYVKFFETPQGQSLLEYDPENQRKLSYKVITEVIETKGEEKIFKHLALYDEKTLEEHENCTILQDDATFLSRPKVHGITQLFTIMARNYGKCFPCIWILMSSRKAHAYEACLKEMKENIWPKMKPVEVIADFEEAMEIAWQNMYPDAKLTGCYFHFTQALLRNAIKKGAASRRNLQDNPERHLILRMVMALALLPVDDIPETYKAIKALARKKHGTHFDKFFEYFDEYWMKRRGPERFSVYDKLDKTNNEQESMHKILNFLFKNRRPHPWKFIDVLIDIQKINNFNLRVERETLGTTKWRRKIGIIFNETDLLRCWYMLKNSPGFTPLMLVTKVAYSLKDKYIQLKQVHSADRFDKNRDAGDIEGDHSSASLMIENEENVISLCINIQDMEDIFDLDHEDTRSEASIEHQESLGPWRIPLEGLLEGDGQGHQVPRYLKSIVIEISIEAVVDYTKCYKKSSAIQRLVAPSHTNDFDDVPVENEVDEVNGRKKPEKRTRRVRLLEPQNLDEVPAKRNRKSVKDGKYSAYFCE